MIKLHDIKITPTQLAKFLVLDLGVYQDYRAISYYKETELDMTKKEKRDVEKAVDKQISRVQSFLNIDDLIERMYDR